MARHEEGFSLVEVIIAMFLLAVLSLAVLPLILRVSALSVTNQDTVSATAFANAQLSRVRAAFPNDSSTSTCTELAAMLAEDIAGTPRGLRADFRPPACATDPGDYPDAVTVEVTVNGRGEASAVVLTTQVLVFQP